MKGEPTGRPSSRCVQKKVQLIDRRTCAGAAVACCLEARSDLLPGQTGAPQLERVRLSRVRTRGFGAEMERFHISEVEHARSS